MSTWKNKQYEDLCRSAVKKYGRDLLKFTPKDAADWGLNENTDKVEFFTNLLGALSVFESNQKPEVTYKEPFKDSTGRNVISRGLLQVSIESSNSYLRLAKIPKLTSAEDLHNPEINLTIGVLILSMWVVQDGVISSAKSPWKGMSRYFSPFRKADRIKAMKAHVAKNLKQETETMTKYDQVYGIAEKEIGVGEEKGIKHNPRIIEYHAGTTYQGKTDEIPWCASFVDWCLKQMGEKSTNSAAAISFMKWGVPLKTPVKGCIVVFSRDGGNHVAFYHSETATQIRCLGGNQSNKVQLSYYPKSRFKGYRGFADSAVTNPKPVVTPNPAQKTNPTKEQAKALQRALNDMGANPKLKIDGIPGPKTKAACIQVASGF